MFRGLQESLAIAVLLLPAYAHAGTKQWVGKEGTSFSEPENWTLPGLDPPTTPPGAGDDALFTPNANGFVVGFAASVANHSATVTGAYQFNLGGNQYEANLLVNSNGRLTLNGGTMLAPAVTLAGDWRLTIEALTTLESDGLISVGGNGQLDLDGGTIIAQDFVVGEADGDSARVVTSGGDITVRGASGLVIGGAGRGTFTLADGTTLSAPRIQLGAEDGGQGTLRVQSGSSLSLLGATILGDRGAGFLFVEDGGSVTLQSVQIGNSAGGALGVSGSDSTLQITSGDVDLGAQAGVSGDLTILQGASLSLPGNLTVGAAGNGSMRLDGRMTVAGNVVVGRDASSDGQVNLDTNQAAAWTISGDLIVGRNGRGKISAEIGDDFLLRATNFIVGENHSGAVFLDEFEQGRIITQTSTIGKNAAGTLRMNAGTWDNANDLIVGQANSGTLSIEGATIKTQNAYLGLRAGSSAQVDIDYDSRLEVANSLYVGGSQLAVGGPATLTVGQGSTLAVGQQLTVYAGSTLFIDDGTVTSELGPIVVPSPPVVGPFAAAAPPPGAELNIHGDVEFKSGGTINAPTPGFLVLIHGTAHLKKSGGPGKTAIVNPQVVVDDGGQIIVEQGTLSLRGGGQFAGKPGTISQPFVLDNGATLNLESSDATTKTYNVHQGTQVVAGRSGGNSSANMTVGDNAHLSIARTAQVTNKLEVFGFILSGNGRIVGDGKFLNSGINTNFTWEGGTIGVTSFVNHGTVTMTSQSAPKVLTGTFENHDFVLQRSGAMFRVDSGGQIRNYHLWELNSDIQGGVLGGAFHNLGGATMSYDTSTLSQDKTVEVTVDFSNDGTVIVRRPFTATTNVKGTLLFSGNLSDVSGDALIGGKWIVTYDGVLDLKGKTIRRIGNPKNGKKVKVSLFYNGLFERLQLEEIRATGALLLNESTLSLPSALVNRGSLVLRSDANLLVQGNFDQHGTLTVEVEIGPPRFAPAILQVFGNVTLHAGSKTTIDGILSMPTIGTEFTVAGGQWGGNGTINNVTVKFLSGKLGLRGSSKVIPGGGSPIAVGDAPLDLAVGAPAADDPVSILTLSDGYFQGAEALLQAEIGGTEPGSEYGQLFVGGTAEFQAGTSIALRFVDPDEPEANTNRFSPAVGDVFDLVVADQILVPDPNDLSSLLVSPMGQFFQPSVFHLPDNRQALRLTTVGDPSSLFGDLNIDGYVDRIDVAQMARSFGLVGMADADLDDDGTVALADVAILQANLGQTSPSPAASQTAVPEPSSLALLLLGLIAMVAQRRLRNRPVMSASPLVE